MKPRTQVENQLIIHICGSLFPSNYRLSYYVEYTHNYVEGDIRAFHEIIKTGNII